MPHDHKHGDGNQSGPTTLRLTVQGRQRAAHSPDMNRTSPFCGWPVPYSFKSNSHTGARGRLQRAVNHIARSLSLGSRQLCMEMEQHVRLSTHSSEAQGSECDPLVQRYPTCLRQKFPLFRKSTIPSSSLRASKTV